MSCDIGEVTERLENELCNSSVALPTSQLILQPFRYFTYVTVLPPTQPFRPFTYVTTHSPTLPSLYLRHSSFSNLSVASPTSKFILQHLFRFSNVTSSSLNSPGELPMLSSKILYVCVIDPYVLYVLPSSITSIYDT